MLCQDSSVFPGRVGWGRVWEGRVGAGSGKGRVAAGSGPSLTMDRVCIVLPGFFCLFSPDQTQTGSSERKNIEALLLGNTWKPFI